MKLKFLKKNIIITYIICSYDTTNAKLVSEDYSVDNCKNANKGDGYCCYYEAPKSEKTKGCTSLTKYEYDHIKVYVKSQQTFGGKDQETEDKDAKIDCNSFYLQISTFIIMLLFLYEICFKKLNIKKNNKN